MKQAGASDNARPGGREDPTGLPQELLISLYLKMLGIRRFEELVMELFSEAKLSGTTHCCIGQEANAVGILSHLDETKDAVVSNHRCHGHYLSFMGKPQILLAELMGRETGVCGGMGGSQHLCDANFFTNGIQGGMVPFAAGLGLGRKLKGQPSVVAVFIGDGTFGQGIIYEAFNMISLWKLPVLIVLENNQYAQSTCISRNTAGNIHERLDSFGIPKEIIKSTDIAEIYHTSRQVIEHMRDRGGPFFLGIETYRFCSHSKSDDYRDRGEIEKMRAFDPLLLARQRIEDKGALEEAEKDIERELEEAVKFAEGSGYRTLDMEKVMGY